MMQFNLQEMMISLIIIIVNDWLLRTHEENKENENSWYF